MLKCFSFRYETLLEDDYSQINLSTGQQNVDSPEKGIKEPYASPTRTVKNNSAKVLTSEKHTVNASTSKQSWHLEKKEETRKARDFYESSQRYTPLPVTQNISNHASSSRNQVWSNEAHLEIVPPCQKFKQSVPQPVSFRRNKMSRSKNSTNMLPDNSSEWPRAEHNSNTNKSGRDWPCPTKRLLDEGVHYNVRYIGCLDINTSMKSLSFETRSYLAKECLNRVCETAGLKTVDKKRKVNKKINRMLAEKPNMAYAGSNVNLTISSASLTLTIMESNEIIANHEMPNISFASAGDADTLDFIAYVAKDGINGRACYVLECGGGLAQDVMITIGQAFQLRYNECLKRNPTVTSSLPRVPSNSHETEASIGKQDDPEYYNDLPGKIPPEAVLSPTFFSEYQNEKRFQSEAASLLDNERCNPGSVGNLIDLSSEPSSPNPLMKTSESIHEYMNDCMVGAASATRGVNGQLPSAERFPAGNVAVKPSCGTCTADPFDMRPFSDSLPQETAPMPPTRLSEEIPSPTTKRHLQNATQLLQEEWYHGSISRKEAESLLHNEGDFLVRESQGSSNQYVLSGMNNGIKKHLLLVDPEGVVRTKDKVFENVSHLVNFHKNNRLPIISVESSLILLNPIIRNRPVR